MMIIHIAGHLGVDPEERMTPSGQKVTNIRMAVNTRKSGQEETVWWRVTVWGDRYEKMIHFLKKGSALIVIGEMQKPEIFNDKEGRPQVSLNITAHHLLFSPFGKPQSQTQTTVQAEPMVKAEGVENGAQPQAAEPVEDVPF